MLSPGQKRACGPAEETWPKRPPASRLVPREPMACRSGTGRANMTFAGEQAGLRSAPGDVHL